MPLPSLFPPGREVVASFNFIEFLQGNGIITFHGAVMPGKTKKYERFESADGSESITTTNWTAQTFTIGTTGDNEDFFPTKLRLSSNVSLIDSIIVEIQETTANKPNGTVVMGFNTTPIKIIENGSNDVYEYDLSNAKSGSVKLSAGTKYAIVIRAAAGTQNIQFDSSGGYSGGSKYDSANSGGSWTIDSGADIYFEIHGTTKNPYLLTSVSGITSSISSSVIQNLNDSATSFSELGNISFEGKINKSAIIEGDALINFTLAGGANIEAWYAVVELYHIRGAIETKIGEAESWTNAAATGIEMELTRTIIAPGDKIKLKMILNYIETTASVNTTITLSHSGSNLTLLLPFKTDI